MSSEGARARAMLDAWRGQGADRHDPVRFHFIEALERRAANLDGEARRALEARLAHLLEDLAAQPGGHAPEDSGDSEVPATPQAAENPQAIDAGAATAPAVRGPLGELADALAAQAATRDAALAVDSASGSPTAFPSLAMLDDFRDLWSRLRTESQWRQSLEPAPNGAGPLNSGSLVHRALILMRELAPEHLQQFLSYVDTLASLERMHENGVLAAAKDAPRAAGARKRGR